MLKKLLFALALFLVCSSIAPSATVSAQNSAGPPPNCHLHPLDPRCRNN